MKRLLMLLSVVVTLLFPSMKMASAAFPFLEYLAQPGAKMIACTPSELDPRNPANQQRLKTSSIHADLKSLRPAFDGLVLYGYHEACTPRVVAVARELKYRAVLLAIWDIKSAAELDGVAELARLAGPETAIGVLVGNEGLTFGRYEMADLKIAAERLRLKLPAQVPLATSEPLHQWKNEELRAFGDFLAPNIHPVFDQKELNAVEAAQWTRDRAWELAEQSGKAVLVKETGFPHAGAPRYSVESQKEFWSAYTRSGLLERRANSPGWVFHGVAFEAFDLPWKSEESKLEIEKSWGLMSPRREPWPAFSVWQNLSETGRRDASAR